MDAMGMNLERRIVAEICTESDNIISAHVFSDGSPVTGTEIQGMVLEIVVRGREWPMNIIMPGMSLMHGMMRAIDKVIALLRPPLAGGMPCQAANCEAGTTDIGRRGVWGGSPLLHWHCKGLDSIAPAGRRQLALHQVQTLRMERHHQPSICSRTSTGNTCSPPQGSGQMQ